MIESELLSIRIFLVKLTLKIGQEKYLLLILFWKLTLGHKIKDLDGEKIIVNFYQKKIVAECIINELLSRTRE